MNAPPVELVSRLKVSSQSNISQHRRSRSLVAETSDQQDYRSRFQYPGEFLGKFVALCASAGLAAHAYFTLARQMQPSFQHSPEFRPNSKYIPSAGNIPITILPVGGDPAYADAVCLDGSPPAYHLSQGQGDGTDKWLVFLESGAWCETLEDCRKRSTESLGGSGFMETELPFLGILSSEPKHNPYFFDWNKVFVRYCDGASFSGTAGKVQGLHMHGKRVFERVLAHLMHNHGLHNASHALLAGCSAGGLASLLRCDDFKSYMSSPESLGMLASTSGATTADSKGTQSPVVKCLSDAGFFPDVLDFYGNSTIWHMFSSVVSLHNTSLNQQCVQENQDTAAKCFFPEHSLKHTQTPFFLLNSLYDIWMLEYPLVPHEAKGEESWGPCIRDLGNCTGAQNGQLEDYKNEVVEKAQGVLTGRPYNGAFLLSCLTHCMSLWDDRWHDEASPRVNGLTLAETVGEWFFGDGQRNVGIDCGYPCNPTCFPHAMGY